MKTVLIDVATQAEVQARLLASLASGKPEKYAHISFDTAEAMARTLTPLRWAMLETMTGAGALGVRELARRLGRDAKAVHTDLTALTMAGVIDRSEAGKYEFPFDRVKVQFELHKAA